MRILQKRVWIERLNDMCRETCLDARFMAGRSIFPAPFLIDLYSVIDKRYGIRRACANAGLAMQTSGQTDSMDFFGSAFVTAPDNHAGIYWNKTEKLFGTGVDANSATGADG